MTNFSYMLPMLALSLMFILYSVLEYREMKRVNLVNKNLLNQINELHVQLQKITLLKTK
jgi:hypothetical protein